MNSSQNRAAAEARSIVRAIAVARRCAALGSATSVAGSRGGGPVGGGDGGAGSGAAPVVLGSARAPARRSSSDATSWSRAPTTARNVPAAAAAATGNPIAPAADCAALTQRGPIAASASVRARESSWLTATAAAVMSSTFAPSSVDDTIVFTAALTTAAGSPEAEAWWTRRVRSRRSWGLSAIVRRRR